MNELRLTVNGELRTAEPGTTVAGLLRTMGVDPARVAVERNRDVVPRATWAEAGLADGDKIEIVAFIGGGSEAAGQLGGRDDDRWCWAGGSSSRVCSSERESTGPWRRGGRRFCVRGPKSSRSPSAGST